MARTSSTSKNPAPKTEQADKKTPSTTPPKPHPEVPEAPQAPAVVSEIPVTPKTIESIAPDADSSASADRFDAVLAMINDAIANFKTLHTHVKQMQKDFTRMTKAATKRTKRGAAGGGAVGDGSKKNPSGFAKPTSLSNAMCDFLGVPVGTEMARTDVTRRLNIYIKENKLQNEQDKRKIHPDAKLSTILALADGKELTFFNLQSYIKHNFVKVSAV